MKKSSERISWDDLIFKNRYRDYGAYELRKKYPLRLAIGIISTFIFAFLIVLFFSYNSFNNQMDEYQELFKNLSVPADLNDLSSLIEQNEIKPQEPKKTESENLEIADEQKIDSSLIEKKEDEISKIDSLMKDSAALAKKMENEKLSADSVYFVYDLPEFPGGPDAFNRYIYARINSMEKFKSNNNHGIVHINFCIDEKGNPFNVFVKDSINVDIDSALCQILKTMPRWIPSKKYNKNLKVIFNIPITL